MQFDVILSVPPDGAELMAGCVRAVHAAAAPAGQLAVTVVCGCFSDEVAAEFEVLKKHCQGFGALELLFGTRGGGVVHHYNLAMRGLAAPYTLFLSAGRAAQPGFFAALAAQAVARPNAAGFECRLLPQEADHPLDPVTLETPFAAPGAFAVKREAFLAAGCFDETLPLKWAYVDLCRKLRGNGGTLYYAPGAAALQFAACCEEEPIETAEAYAADQTAALMLGYRYGHAAGARRAFRAALKAPRHFAGVRKKLLAAYAGHFAKLWGYWGWRFKSRTCYQNKPPRFWEDVAFHRGGAPLAAPLQNAQGGPLVSVVVRTHKRPQALQNALQSLQNQTYRNFEVVVAEDGEPLSRPVAEAFTGLKLQYHATGSHAGRSRTGNLGLQKATGEYLCFLDDDDLFYPEHLELMVAAALKHPEADMILGTALAHLRPDNEKPEAPYGAGRLQLMHFDRLDNFTMSQMCQIAIQSVLFKKSLYRRCGGLDERLTAHEDWAMWLRFLAVAKRINPQQVDVHRATSVFVQTSDEAAAARRLGEYSQNDAALFGDEDIRFEVSLAEMRRYYRGLLADVRHVKNLGRLDEFLAHNGAQGAEAEVGANTEAAEVETGPDGQ